MNAAQVRSLSRAEAWSTGFAVFQNSEINIPVAEPDTLLSSFAGPAIELRQTEMLLVKLCGLCGIIGDECDMPNASHLPTSLQRKRLRKARVLLFRLSRGRPS